MGRKCNVLLAALAIGVALLVPRLLQLGDILDLTKPPVQDKNSNDCSVVTKDTAGSNIIGESFEDIVYVRTHNNEVTALGCTGELYNTWHTKNLSDVRQQGACYMFDPRDPTKLTAVPFEGFPAHLAFHAHGVYYTGFNEINQNDDLNPAYINQEDAARKKDGAEQENDKRAKSYPLLFVINHAYNKGGERVEAFELRDPDGRGYVLSYRGSLGADYFTAKFNGIINDLVVDIEHRTVYFSQFRPTPESINGRASGSKWEQKLGYTLIKVYGLLGMLNAKMWRCHLPPDFAALMEPLSVTAKVAAQEKHIPVTRCEEVANGKMIANGVQAVNLNAIQQRIVFLNDVPTKRIHVYATSISAAEPDSSPLLPVGEVALTHSLDNIEVSRLAAHHHPTMSSSNKGGFFDPTSAAASDPAVKRWKFGFFGGAVGKIADASRLPDDRGFIDSNGVTFTQIVLERNASAPSGFSLSAENTKTADLLFHSKLQGGTASGVVLPASADIGSVDDGSLGSLGSSYSVVMGSWRDYGAAVCNVKQ